VGTLIDTSVFVAADRGHVDLTTLISDAGDEDTAMAAMTASELLEGVHAIRSAVGRARSTHTVEGWLQGIRVVSFDLDIARTHALLSAQLRATGTMIGAHDLIIAATAVRLHYRIATRDLRSFPKIRGLHVVRW